MILTNGNNYYGEWELGKNKSKGIIFYANGEKFEGQFINENR